MKSWWKRFLQEWDEILDAISVLIPIPSVFSKQDVWVVWGGLASVLMILVVAVNLSLRNEIPVVNPVKIPEFKMLLGEEIDLTKPVRDEPKKFPRHHREPVRREYDASGQIGVEPFDPEVDLIWIDDRRVWWESEHDRDDTEDDHLMHRAMVIPFKRLVNLVDQAGGKLKVQDTYREAGIHHSRSLHREGRAIDLTSEVISLSKLAKLTWAAGFDWVLYEAPKNGGIHIHASVKANRDELVIASPDEASAYD